MEEEKKSTETPVAEENLLDARKRMRDLRIEKNITQADLAKRLGTTVRQIQYYERHQHRLTADKILQVCIALDVTPDEFYGLTENARITDLNTVEARLQAFGKEYPNASLRELYRRVCTVKSLLEVILAEQGHPGEAIHTFQSFLREKG